MKEDHPSQPEFQMPSLLDSPNKNQQFPWLKIMVSILALLKKRKNKLRNDL
jgi:hypothetical protein